MSLKYELEIPVKVYDSKIHPPHHPQPRGPWTTSV